MFCLDQDDDGVCDGADSCPLQPNVGDVDCDRVGDIDEPPCESDPLNGAIRPERIDGVFAGADDDGDTLVDEALPPGERGVRLRRRRLQGLCGSRDASLRERG